MTLDGRQQVAKRLRFEVFKRDNHTCRYCHATDSPLTIDHVIPVSLGGTDDPTNLVTACKDCNSGKGSTAPDDHLVDDVSQDALRWSSAMRQVAATFLTERNETEALYGRLYDVWDNLDECYRRGRMTLPANWTDTIDHWVKLGVPEELIGDAFGVAARNKLVDTYNVWRYACGIVWKRVAQMQEAARALLATDEARP